MKFVKEIAEWVKTIGMWIVGLIATIVLLTFGKAISLVDKVYRKFDKAKAKKQSAKKASNQPKHKN